MRNETSAISLLPKQAFYVQVLYFKVPKSLLNTQAYSNAAMIVRDLGVGCRLIPTYSGG